MIQYVQKYIQVELLPLLEKIDEENSISIDKTMFFGNIYMSNPNQFKFSLGEIVQIKEIAKFVSKIVDSEDSSSNIQYFSESENCQQKCSTRVYPIIGRFFCKDDAIMNIDSNEVWKTKLFDDILNSYEEFGFEIEGSIDDIISVNQKADGSILGKTKCVFCVKSKKKRYEYNVPHKFYKNELHWTTTNFKKHLKTHKLEPIHQIPSKKRKKISESASKTSPNQKVIYVDTGETLETQKNAANFSIEDIAIIEETCGNDQQTGEIDNENLYGLMYDQIANRLVIMKQQCDMHDEELVEMKFLVEKELCLSQIVIVGGDGNCLFSAIAHQIFGSKLNSAELTMQSTQLRATVVQLIQNNISAFKMELLGSVPDGNEANACEDYLDKLSQDRFWGGVEVTKAVSVIHSVNILIINENGKAYFPHGFEIKFENTLIIAYKSNVHYDSIVHIDAPYIFKIVGELVSRCETNQQSNECISDEKINLDCLNIFDTVKSSMFF